MKAMEWTTEDKSKWGRGAWQQEPDKRQWQDAATGLPCLIVRNHGGALCGYVGVPDTHPLHGKGYDDVDVDVHGGLTFADACTPITPERFDQMLERLESSRTEAAKYPTGDSANYIREWSGVTSFDAFREKAQGRFICHLPEPGEPDNIWWFGFDCAHSCDKSPAYDFRSILNDGSYRTIDYVERECASLAKQLDSLKREATS